MKNTARNFVEAEKIFRAVSQMVLTARKSDPKTVEIAAAAAFGATGLDVTAALSGGVAPRPDHGDPPDLRARVSEWLTASPRRWLSIHDVPAAVLGADLAALSPAEIHDAKTALAAVMRSLGYSPTRRARNGMSIRFWRAPSPVSGPVARSVRRRPR